MLPSHSLEDTKLPVLGFRFLCEVLLFAVLGFELRAYTLSHSTGPFL
jgi:hypothetical protein